MAKHSEYRMFRIMTFSGEDVAQHFATQPQIKDWARAKDLHVMFGWDDGHTAWAHVKPLGEVR